MRRVILKTPVITPLMPHEIANQIESARVNEYLGADIIEVNCKERCRLLEEDERWLLTEQGYVPLFSHLVVGWDMWVKHADVKTNMFFQNQQLPLTMQPL